MYLHLKSKNSTLDVAKRSFKLGNLNISMLCLFFFTADYNKVHRSAQCKFVACGETLFLTLTNSRKTHSKETINPELRTGAVRLATIIFRFSKQTVALHTEKREARTYYRTI